MSESIKWASPKIFDYKMPGLIPLSYKFVSVGPDSVGREADACYYGFDAI